MGGQGYEEANENGQVPEDEAKPIAEAAATSEVTETENTKPENE